MSDNVIKFTREVPQGMHPHNGESGQVHILKAFDELKTLVEGGEIEGLVVVGTAKDGNHFGAIAGVMSPSQMAGLLEGMKLTLLMG